MKRYRFIRRISPISDTGDICCIVKDNVQKNAFFRRSSQRRNEYLTVAAKIGEWDVNLRGKLPIYIDEFVVLAILNYLNVEIRQSCNAKNDTHARRCRTSSKFRASLFRKIKTAYGRPDVQNLDTGNLEQREF